MAEKLYYNNVYLADFKANVLSVIEKDGLFHVVLDKTAFYPEGDKTTTTKAIQKVIEAGCI